MEVFIIPVALDRYELYCEVPDDSALDDAPTTGILGRLGHRFRAMVHAAEARQHAHPTAPVEPERWWRRVQDRIVAWVAERIAEQRLLWNLRRQTSATAVHPEDLTFEEAMRLIRRTLERDYERHRVWLVVDTLGLVASGLVMLVPGPNLIAYYFAFRVVGHWLSMRGASQGLARVEWTSKPCPPLTELRRVVTLEPAVRDRHVHDIAARLRLPQLPTFLERIAISRA